MSNQREKTSSNLFVSKQVSYIDKKILLNKTVLPSYLLRESDKVQFCTCFEKPVKLKTKHQHIQKKEENKCFFFILFYFFIFC
jgi:hypothetical protein